MKLSLPSSLLALILTTVAQSSPIEKPDISAVGSVQLNFANFKPLTARGTWLVEYFSPYCGHCRHFAPTWDDVAQFVKGENEAGHGKTAAIRTAQVNCATSGDLCDAQKPKVKSYPTMRIYVDGEFKEEFEGERSYVRLLAFASSYAPPPGTKLERLPGEPEVEASANATPGDWNTDTPALQVQETRSNSQANPDGIVLPLNPGNFENAVKSGPTFVKFFAPWCGYCKKLAPTWVELAKSLQNKLTVAEVNCDVYSSLCKQQGVEGYPMLYFYREGKKLSYTGKQTLEAMEGFAEQAVAPAVQVLPESHSVTNLLKEHEVIFLFLHIAPDVLALNIVREAGNTILNQPPIHIYTSTSPELRSQYGNTSRGPTIVALKAPGGSQASDFIPTASLPIVKGTSKQEIHSFLARNSVPLVSELDSDNFVTIMGARSFDLKPLVVIMGAKPEDKTKAAKMVTDGEEYWRKDHKVLDGPARDVIWTYIDGDKWGSWLKSMYGLKQNKLPSYIIADHSRLVYYDQYKSGKHFDNSALGMSKAVSQVLEGKLVAKHSQNIAQRAAAAVASYGETIVELFIAHPVWMLLLIVAAMAVFAWIASDMLSTDAGPPRPGGTRLRLGEKYDRRLD